MIGEHTYDTSAYKSGLCDLGDGHYSYVECFGNKELPAILFIHGGPGSGFTDGHKQLFDSNHSHVIFYDQRGAGRSTPYCAVEDNTTNRLIEDIPRVLDYAGVERVHIVGVSWGVALGLLFAVRYPERVSGFVLASVFLATRAEAKHFVDGSVASVYPEAWHRFVMPVPADERNTIAEWYLKRMTEGSEEEKDELARRWAIYDLSISSGVIDCERLERACASISYRSLVLYTALYIAHDFFLPDGYIQQHIKELPSVSMSIIHGMQDAVTDVSVAERLHALVPESQLFLVDAGHGSSAMFDMIREQVARIYG
ncbi:MAG: alpha/beta fold hydrolase [Candidatus Yonathbacteria bacterium]|nr:alpha/beta fold hydrolase [Candidatus Yonathbacteria bacterium]